MIKKTLMLVLLLALVLSVTVPAQATNREMQLMGGVVVSNATDSFFFAPMEEGLTKHWGLYALSSAQSGPISEIEDGYPARLVHADSTHVYFMGYTDAERTIHSLYAVEIASGTYEELLTNIKDAFVATDDEFLYVSGDDPYTLRSYNITSRKDTKVKDMSGSKKYIYDAAEFGGEIYFLTKTDSGSEDGYKLNASNNKANNLDKPDPALVTSLLYEGYRVYAGDNAGTQVYSVKIGDRKGVRIGANFAVSLSNPRFGNYIYVYNGEANQLVACPLDGADAISLPLETSMLSRLVMGGTASEILLIGNDAIYAMPTSLASQTRLFDFDNATGGQLWSHVAPAGDNAIMVFGYGAETFTHANNLMPTGVYAYDRATGEMLFGYPEYDPTIPVHVTPPTVIGDVPVEQRGEGETYFNWQKQP